MYGVMEHIYLSGLAHGTNHYIIITTTSPLFLITLIFRVMKIQHINFTKHIGLCTFSYLVLVFMKYKT